MYIYIFIFKNFIVDIVTLLRVIIYHWNILCSYASYGKIDIVDVYFANNKKILKAKESTGKSDTRVRRKKNVIIIYS